MITLTDGAASQVQRLVQQREQPSLGLRISICAGGCAGLQYELAYESTERKGDTVVEAKGVRLYVDPFSAPFLEGACLDYLDTPTGAGFRVQNPLATATCACGASFRIEGRKETEKRCGL